jgi:ABC-type transporter Mla maintaining outer membrane lipid asymmetry ATPase subunit MlaF
MKTAISFKKSIKSLHGSPAVCIDDLQIYDRECVAFYGLTEEVAEVITNQITGAYSPEEGNVYLFGTDSRQMADSSWFDYIGDFAIHRNGTPFRETASIGENIATLLRSRIPGIEEPQLSSDVLSIANLVQLTITDLSRTIGDAGSLLRMKSRMARTLAFQPRLVIFFEPSEDLSYGITRKMMDLIRRTRRKLKYTALIFTSDVRLLQELADRVFFLNPLTGLVVENELREWYHNLLPFLQPSPSKLLQLARNILQYGGFRDTKV